MLRCSSIKFMLVCVIATLSKKNRNLMLYFITLEFKLYYLRLINSKTRLIPLFTWSDDSASHLIIENRELSSQVLRLWNLIKSTPRTHDNYGFMRNNTSLPMSLNSVMRNIHQSWQIITLAKNYHKLRGWIKSGLCSVRKIMMVSEMAWERKYCDDYQ